MRIIIKNNSDENIKFKAENMIDGMKIGIIKEKLAEKGIPVSIGMNFKDNSDLDITITQKDLIDLLC